MDMNESYNFVFMAGIISCDVQNQENAKKTSRGSRATAAYVKTGAEQEWGIFADVDKIDTSLFHNDVSGHSPLLLLFRYIIVTFHHVHIPRHNLPDSVFPKLHGNDVGVNSRTQGVAMYSLLQ